MNLLSATKISPLLHIIYTELDKGIGVTCTVFCTMAHHLAGVCNFIDVVGC